jgi:NADH-ubiquinone oxidoreductase chain 5
LKDIYLGVGTDFVGTHILPNNFSYFDTELSITQFYKLLPLISAILVSILIVVLNEFFAIVFNLNNKYINTVYSIFNQKLVSDQILNHFIIFKGLVTSGNIAHHVDKGSLYRLGPVGINRLLNKASYNVINLSSNTRSSLSMNSMLILITIVSLLLLVLVMNVNFIIVIPVLISILYILFS